MNWSANTLNNLRATTCLVHPRNASNLPHPVLNNRRAPRTKDDDGCEGASPRQAVVPCRRLAMVEEVPARKSAHARASRSIGGSGRSMARSCFLYAHVPAMPGGPGSDITNTNIPRPGSDITNRTTSSNLPVPVEHHLWRRQSSCTRFRLARFTLLGCLLSGGWHST